MEFALHIKNMFYKIRVGSCNRSFIKFLLIPENIIQSTD